MAPHARGRHVVIEVVIDLNRGGPGARSHALDFFERHAAIGTNLLVPDTEFVTGLIVKLRGEEQLPYLTVCPTKLRVARLPRARRRQRRVAGADPLLKRRLDP